MAVHWRKDLKEAQDFLVAHQKPNIAHAAGVLHNAVKAYNELYSGEKHLDEQGLDQKWIDPSNVPWILALMVWGEARGENVRGWKGVIQVVYNRSEKTGIRDGDEIILKPYQFSCFNADNSRQFTRDMVNVDIVGDVVSTVVRTVGEIENLRPFMDVGLSTLYCTEKCFVNFALAHLANQHPEFKSMEVAKPGWDMNKVVPRAQIKNHVFFVEV